MNKSFKRILNAATLFVLPSEKFYSLGKMVINIVKKFQFTVQVFGPI
jgi:hypothetical protein